MLISGNFGTGENSATVMMSASDPVLIIFSIANLFLLGYFAYILYSIFVKDEVKGVVIVEGNYFKYAWGVIKAAALAVAAFCTKTLPVFFTKTVPGWFKKSAAEDSDVSKGQ